MSTPYPFPFANQPKADFSSGLRQYYGCLNVADMDKPEVIAELDLTHASLMEMARDPLYAVTALHIEIRLVNQLHSMGSNNPEGNLGVVHAILRRYGYLDYPVAAAAKRTMDHAWGDEANPATSIAKEKAMEMASSILKESISRLGERPILYWTVEANEPMFSKSICVALYMVDPALLGVHVMEHERYFALRSTELSPKWKKITMLAKNLLNREGLAHTSYEKCLDSILARQDWIRPREVNLALSMMNAKFNYAQVIEAWPDKASLLDRFGYRLQSYTNQKPWLTPYTKMVVHLCHAMDLKGDHSTLNELMTTLLLPHNLHRDGALEAIRLLSSLTPRLGEIGLSKHRVLERASLMAPNSREYFELLREEGLENQAYLYLKKLCAKDSSLFVRLMKQTGLEQYRRVPDESRERAMSIDLGL